MIRWKNYSEGLTNKENERERTLDDVRTVNQEVQEGCNKGRFGSWSR